MSTDKLNLDSSSALEELNKKIEEKEAAAAAAKEEEPAEAATEEDSLTELLAKHGLSNEDVERAKEKFGDVFMFTWSDERIYLFRPLKRAEWTALQKAAETEDEFQFLLIKHGCVYPNFLSKSQLDDELAGLPESLSGLIAKSSGFIPLDQALAITRIL